MNKQCKKLSKSSDDHNRIDAMPTASSRCLHGKTKLQCTPDNFNNEILKNKKT